MNQLAVHQDTAHNAQSPGFVEPRMPTPRRDANRSTIAGRRPDDFVFEPRDSTMFFEQEMVLNSRPIQIAFDRTFQRCQLALFETEMIAPIVARNDDGVRAVCASLDTKINKFAEYMEGELNRVNKILSDNGRPLTRGDFTNPMHVKVKVFTPRARRLVEMLQLADDMISAYGRTWLEGFMDEINFKRSVFTVRMRTIYLAREIWELHTRSYIGLRKARQAADAERQSLIERRQAKGNSDASTDGPSEADIARLSATVEGADKIIGDIDQRGGLESAAPDFGTNDLAKDDPQLMAAEQQHRAVTKGSTRKRTGGSHEDSASAHEGEATA